MTLKLRLKSLLKRIAFAYLLVCVLMFALQRRIIFVPEAGVGEPAGYGLADYKKLWITASDGVHLEVWYHPAQSGYPTIVHFHGNGGNIGGRAPYFRMLSDKGFGVIGLDYRGYGRSEGSPSEQGVYMDARATIEYASKELSIKPEQMIAYGESLGTGVAVQMATEYPFQGIVLQSPFTSILQLGKDAYPWLPVEILQLDRFDSLSKIGKIRSPLFLIHGTIDIIVPIKYGKQLFAAAPEPKESYYYPYAKHTDINVETTAEMVLEFAKKHGMIKQ